MVWPVFTSAIRRISSQTVSALRMALTITTQWTMRIARWFTAHLPFRARIGKNNAPAIGYAAAAIGVLVSGAIIALCFSMPIITNGIGSKFSAKCHVTR